MIAIWAAVLLTLGIASAQAGAEGKLVDYTPEEMSLLLSHGPWPAPSSRDPSNRVSGNADAIAFGRQLFFEPRLSTTGTVACTTCHKPERHWTDGRKLGLALGEVDRNTPSLANVRLNRWFGWDGGADSLWGQSMRPIFDARELGATEQHLAGLLHADSELQCRYRRVFGSAPPQDGERLVVDLAKSIAAFLETLSSGRTPFDDFRDALARGDLSAASAYPAAAQRGAKIFAGRGNCSLCHFGPNFSHGEFHEVGIPIVRKSGGVDWGRYDGIKMLRASRFNLLGSYNDDAVAAPGTSTRHVALEPVTFEQFKVPSLRNVAQTAPYMHNGHFATLSEVVRHYSEIDPSRLHQAHVYLGGDYGLNELPPTDTMLRPLNLTAAEIADVVAFLETLTENQPAPLPSAAQGATCR